MTAFEARYGEIVFAKRKNEFYFTLMMIFKDMGFRAPFVGSSELARETWREFKGEEEKLCGSR